MSCSSAAYSSHSRSRSVRPWIAARLVEQRHRQPRDLLRVLRPVVAALGELDDAAAPDVGVAIGLRDLLAVPRDVVEDEPFAQRQVAERDLVGAEPAQRSRRAGSRRRRREVGAPRLEAGHAQPLLEIERRQRPCGRGAAAWPRRGGCAAWPAAPRALVRRGDRAEAQDRARRADRRDRTRLRDLVEVLAELGVDVPHELALVARRDRVALHEPLGQPDDAELEAAPDLHRSARRRA